MSMDGMASQLKAIKLKSSSSGKKASSAKKKKAILKKPIWPGALPHLCYDWEDRLSNNYVTIEVNLPSGSIPQDYHMELKIDKADASQYLRITFRLTSAFLDMMNFDEQITDMSVHVKDASLMSNARKAKIQELKRLYAEKYDLEKKFTNMTMDIPLPFVCEDIFNLKDYQGSHPNTMNSIRSFNTRDDEGFTTTVLTLIVTLVKKDPVHKRFVPT